MYTCMQDANSFRHWRRYIVKIILPCQSVIPPPQTKNDTKIKQQETNIDLLEVWISRGLGGNVNVLTRTVCLKFITLQFLFSKFNESLLQRNNCEFNISLIWIRKSKSPRIEPSWTTHVYVMNNHHRRFIDFCQRIFWTIATPPPQFNMTVVYNVI